MLPLTYPSLSPTPSTARNTPTSVPHQQTNCHHSSRPDDWTSNKQAPSQWYWEEESAGPSKFANLAKATALVLHVPGATIRAYHTRESVHKVVEQMREQGTLVLDKTIMFGARPPPNKQQVNMGVQPPTLHPGLHCNNPIPSSDLAESLVNTHENNKNKPPIVVPPPPEYEPIKGMGQIPLCQLAITPMLLFQPSLSPSPACTTMQEIVNATTREVVGRLVHHSDGTATLDQA